MKKRLLVTASRYLKHEEDYGVVTKGLGIAIFDLMQQGATEITVVHGDCPTGGDAFTTEFINKIERSMRSYNLILRLETHPADWSKGKAAGPARNKHMVELGANLAVVFPQKGAPNKGTFGTRTLITEAGIPHQEYWSNSVYE